jgi:hypothetical protein
MQIYLPTDRILYWYIVTLSAKLANYKSIAPALSIFTIKVEAPASNKKPYFASNL